jgi:hypothetical protein
VERSTLDIGGQIASQSVVVSNAFPTGKYSYSLLDDVGLSRIVNLSLTVSDGTNSTLYAMTSQVVANAPGALAGETGAVDFDYVANAGQNPPPPNLTAAQKALATGNARSILNGNVTTNTYTDKFGGIIADATRKRPASAALYGCVVYG